MTVRFSKRTSAHSCIIEVTSTDGQEVEYVEVSVELDDPYVFVDEWHFDEISSPEE